MDHAIPETVGRTRDGQKVATVYERLRTAILSGEIEPGAIIPQGVLASEFGAGRTPLREALRMLQGEGLVVSEPNRRVVVAKLSAEDAEQLYLMRIALEALAIRITVPALTSHDIAELEGRMAEMEHHLKVGDPKSFGAPHRAFHHRLIAGGGPRVSAEIGRLADHAERYRLEFGGPGSWSERQLEHRLLLDAAAAGDPDGAVTRLAAHHAETARAVFTALDPRYDLTRLGTAITTLAPGAETALRVG